MTTIPNAFFSYIRVSTLRQGQTGTSLTEQQAAISGYADRAGFVITQQYEEKETAAKLGRPVFNEMLKALKAGKARGVIIHKIDRSARNLEDWVRLQTLVENGIEIHFANESVDLTSRGGKLAADIQAVVAADYIRNLREETKKGFYGRLKQGLYPRPAPPGYFDCGKGQPKAIDPTNGPLVRQAFELYGTGNWGLERLAGHLAELGLRGKSGSPVSRNGLSKLLHNHFYYGLVKIKISGELYSGQHEPLISKEQFDRVQQILAGKAGEKQTKHQSLWRKTITCASCQRRLIGEQQKGHCYYRCHTNGCPQKGFREEVIEAQFLALLKTLQFTELENEHIRQEIKYAYGNVTQLAATRQKALQAQLDQTQTRLASLADMYVDSLIERDTYVAQKNSLLRMRQEIQEQLSKVDAGQSKALTRVEQFVELVNNACLSYEWANPAEKREFIKIVTSNLMAEGKTLIFKLHYPFQLVLDRKGVPGGSPHRGVPRTLEALVRELVVYFAKEALSVGHEISARSFLPG